MSYPYLYNQYPNINQVQSQSFFPSPQGSFYTINNGLEISNIPVNSGISAALCFNEGILYLKSLQNGTPVMVAYHLVPFENEKKEDLNKLEDLENRIAALEKNQKSGGDLNVSTKSI